MAKNVHPCRMQIASIMDTIGQDVFDESSHLKLNSNETTLLWSPDNNSDKIIVDKPLLESLKNFQVPK